MNSLKSNLNDEEKEMNLEVKEDDLLEKQDFEIPPMIKESSGMFIKRQRTNEMK